MEIPSNRFALVRMYGKQDLMNSFADADSPRIYGHRHFIELSDGQIDLLVADLADRYGYDFSNYSAASLKRRMKRLVGLDLITDFSAFRHRLNHDSDYGKHVVNHITVGVTEMFRDPSFYKTLRDTVIPALVDKPAITLWHAGCSTGEEVYSVAILLHEAGLLHKSTLYGTDINTTVLERAREGVFGASHVEPYKQNYQEAGGSDDFSTYVRVTHTTAQFQEALKKHVFFLEHNLVSGGSLGKFDMILCRNVMIYFDKDLQERVLALFDRNLNTDGFLALGSKETLTFSGLTHGYKQVENREKIWQRIHRIVL
jgi:chemotaxis protein methyltransferase CheR